MGIQLCHRIQGLLHRNAGTLLLAAGVFSLALSCKDGDPPSTTNLGPGVGGPVGLIALSTAGTSGCNGGDQSFLFCNEIDLAAALVGLSPAVSSLTRIAGAQSGSDLFYATAVLSASGDSTVLELDLSDPNNPIVSHLLPLNALDNLVTGLLGGVSTQARLAGIAVLDATSVLVVDLASNTILAVGRGTPGFLVHFAGSPSQASGFLDGDAHAAARFAFDPESELCPTDDGRVFIADTGNNAVRIVFSTSAIDPSNIVITASGMGPGAGASTDGDLAVASFDAPTGLVVHCANRLIVSERGDGGEGHRLRAVHFFDPDPTTGALTGMVMTEVGDGIPTSTQGVGLLAQVAAPQSPQVSSTGELYWIDSSTGVLRRESATAFVDCPLAPMGDCTTASSVCSAGVSDFTPGASFSTALSGDGDLYVLQSGTTLLRRFGP